MHSINYFLDSKLTDKSLLQEKLNAIVLPLLPAASHSHICAANYDNQELILVVDSPVWAARLRTQHKTITDQLKNKLNFPVKTFRIKFQQPVRIKSKQAKTKPSLSNNSAKLIRQTANSIEDEELKQSLLRLSQHSD